MTLNRSSLEAARWLWYAFDPARKQVLCWELSERTEATCQRLLNKLAGCLVMGYGRDRLEAYRKLLPAARQWIGKGGRHDIEGNKLNFRTRLKRQQRQPICFSREDEMQEAVTKLYIRHLNAHQHLLRSTTFVKPD